MEVTSAQWMTSAPKPYSVQPQYRPDGSPDPTREWTYRFTLDLFHLHRLGNPRCPIGHIYPSETWTGPGTLEEKRSRCYQGVSKTIKFSAIHKMAMLHIQDVYTHLYEDFFEALATNFRPLNPLQSEWKSKVPPDHLIYLENEYDFYKAFTYGVVNPVQALLNLLPIMHRLRIVPQDEAKSHLNIERIQGHKSDYYCVAAVPGGRALMVMEIKPWLDRKTFKALRRFVGQPQGDIDKSMSPEDIREHTTCYATLQQLAHQMRLSNAVLGAIYNGNDLIVFERELDHDMALVNDAPSPIPDDYDRTLRLWSWDVSFAHPFDSEPQCAEDRFDASANAVVCFAALIYHAYQRLLERDDQLDDPQIDRKLPPKRGTGSRCHCPASNAVRAAGVPPLEAHRREQPHSPSIMPALEDLLSELELGPAPQPEGGVRDEEGDTFIALGKDAHLPVPGAYPRSYRLICPIDTPRAGGHTLVYLGDLHNFDAREEPTAASRLITSTQAMRRPTESVPKADPDKLYAASALLRKYEEGACASTSSAPAQIHTSHTVLKLPNFFGGAVGSSSLD